MEAVVIAAVLADIFGLSGVTADDIFVTEGSSKGINLVFQSIEGSHYSVVLPLPTYFACELSALRRNVPVSCYYRPDTSQIRTVLPWRDRSRTIVLETIPNGVTGFAGSWTDPAGEPTLALLDCVFMVGRPGGSSWPSLARRDLTRTVLTFTASKDFSMPGLRAGLLVTKNQRVKSMVQYDRVESTYSVCALARRVILLYILAVAAYHLRSTSSSISAAVNRVLQIASSAAAASFGLRVLPQEPLLVGIVQHLIRMESRYALNWSVVLPTVAAGGGSMDRPQAGYSCLLGLPPEVERHARGDVARWVNQVGRRFRLKLNPSLLFGANSQIWRELYGTDFYVRVNLSDETEGLQQVMALLAEAVSAKLETWS